MAAVTVDPAKIREFNDFSSFYQWLETNHDVETEVWIKLHKKASGLASITPVEAIDACLCWGWIDAIRKGFDDRSFLQRYTRRGPRSTWSKVNVDNVARLVAAGQMTGHGLRHVEAAKADGRWDKAYSLKDAVVPDDLMAAISADQDALAFFGKLSAQNRFALIFRLNALKTDAGRAKRVAAYVEMLRRGETIHPQRQK